MSKLILLIDDDQDDAELFSDALEELGMDAEVAHFYDGNVVLEKLREKALAMPDIIFLDINMPHMNGWDCLRQIKKIAFLQQIPIVMYSTSNLVQEGVRAEDVGANAFLTKPSHFGELKANLSALFSQLLKRNF